MKPLAMISLLLLSLPACAEQLRDPTRPLGEKSQLRVEKTQGRDLPVLNSILISQTRRIAIIDGKAYEKNDRIATYVVTKISPHYVILRGESDKLELRLRSRGLKQNKQDEKMEAYISVVKESQP